MVSVVSSNLIPLEITLFLPPAYKVRGKVIFILGNVCLSTFLGGVPPSFPMARGGGVLTSQVRIGGPHLRSGWGVPPSQVRTGGTPVYPHQDWVGYHPPIGTGWGYPHWDWMGVPPPPLGLDGGTSPTPC